MIKRKIIKIHEELCNGCGLCAEACHEGAIGMIDGKATLLRDDYCDGLGDCLPVCPTGAITFEEREAAAYDEEAVQANMTKRQNALPACGCPGTLAQAIPREADTLACGCPGTLAQAIPREADTLACGCPGTLAQTIPREADTLACGCPGTSSRELSRESGEAPMAAPAVSMANPPSHLAQWPVQLKLVPVNAPYFNHADLLIAADCTAFAHGEFHRKFMKNRITLIGCPKLDDGDYSEKLTAILLHNDIKSVMVVRMEVPCCGGIVNAVTAALKACGKMIPWQIVTVATDGRILE